MNRRCGPRPSAGEIPSWPARGFFERVLWNGMTSSVVLPFVRDIPAKIALRVYLRGLPRGDRRPRFPGVAPGSGRSRRPRLGSGQWRSGLRLTPLSRRGHAGPRPGGWPVHRGRPRDDPRWTWPRRRPCRRPYGRPRGCPGDTRRWRGGRKPRPPGPPCRARDSSQVPSGLPRTGRSRAGRSPACSGMSHRSGIARPPCASSRAAPTNRQLV